MAAYRQAAALGRPANRGTMRQKQCFILNFRIVAERTMAAGAAKDKLAIFFFAEGRRGLR
jgi:hypothetical protein